MPSFSFAAKVLTAFIIVNTLSTTNAFTTVSKSLPHRTSFVNVNTNVNVNSPSHLSLVSSNQQQQSEGIDNNDTSDLEDTFALTFVRQLKATTAAFVTAGVLCTGSIDVQNNHEYNTQYQQHQPYQQYQSERITTTMNQIETSNNVNVNMNLNKHFNSIFQFIEPANAIENENNNGEVEVESPILPPPAPVSSLAQQELSPRTKLERSTVIDEIWTLIDKYYIDQTFQNQDWSVVRSNYESKLTINSSNSNGNGNGNVNYDDEEAMKIASTMVSSLGDKYSRILDKAAYARIQKFDLIGVGATLMPNPIDKRIMVGAPPVEGSEASKGGIQYGDYIIKVNGKETEGRTAFDIIDQITEDQTNAILEGNLGNMITFTVLTESTDVDGNGNGAVKGEGLIRDVTMKRQTMEVKNPISYKISERRKDGTVVGYIRLSEFNSLVEPKLKEALSSLKSDGANAYVLDMRSNPGGAFQSAVEIASLFMEDKIATSVVDSNLVEMPFKTAKGKVMIDNSNPLVLWVDGGSASATEVLAGALHDQCRASIMGSHSFGKGLIQAVYGLKNGGGLVLTVAKYVTPNGTNIQGSGIMPDLEAKLPFLYLSNLSSDTSKVDFNKMMNLQPMCVADK